MKCKPVIKQKLSSGNKVEIFLKERSAPNFFEAQAEWLHFPPSLSDRREYQMLVAPRVLRLAARVRQISMIRETARNN